MVREPVIGIGTAGVRGDLGLGVAVEVCGVSEVVVKVDGTEDIGTLRQGSSNAFFGDIETTPNGARIWEGEGDRETVGQAIDRSGDGSMDVGR